MLSQLRFRVGRAVQMATREEWESRMYTGEWSGGLIFYDDGKQRSVV
jgi:hypothetical protein